MAKSKRNKKRQHIQKVKGRRFTDEIRNLNLEKVLIIPIDAGKNSHKVLVANYFGDILYDTFEFANSITGIKMCNSIIQEVCSSINAQKIVIGIESTGHYYENLYRNLITLGYDVAIINPSSVYSQRTGQLNWCKTDDIDLCAIGQVLIDNQATETKLSDGLYYNLKHLTRLRRDEVNKRARLKIQIKALCDHIFPGLQKSKIFSDFWGKASMLLLENYPTPCSIIRLGVKRLARFFKKHNTKLGLITAQRLLNLARNSLTTNASNLYAHLFNLKFKIQDLKMADEKIRKLNVELAQHLVKTPGILLLSIRKINVPSAAEFLGEVGPLPQAGNAKKIIARAGLNPSKFQTAEYERADNPITKHGSNPLRNASLTIAHNLVGDEPHLTNKPANPYFRAFFDHLVNEEGKDKRVAKVACANKFIRIAWAMMTQKKLFCPPTWNQDRAACEPLAKLEKFLIENNAKDILELAVHIAKEQLPANYSSYVKQKENDIDSPVSSLTFEQERDPVTFLGPISSSLEEVKPVV
jgi:transposase